MSTVDPHVAALVEGVRTQPQFDELYPFLEYSLSMSGQPWIEELLSHSSSSKGCSPRLLEEAVRDVMLEDAGLPEAQKGGAA